MLELNSSWWLRGKKEAINNNDNNNNNDFQNALDDALNYQNIEKDPQRISKLKHNINQYNWKGIKFPAGPEELIKFERNNKTIALNMLFINYNAKTIRVAYRSEQNNKCQKQAIFLMISDGNKWHYLAVTTYLHCFKEIHQIMTEIFIV